MYLYTHTKHCLDTSQPLAAKTISQHPIPLLTIYETLKLACAIVQSGPYMQVVTTISILM